MTPLVATVMLQDLVVCPHRGTMDLFGGSAEDDESSPLFGLVWERGSICEKDAAPHHDAPPSDAPSTECFRRWVEFDDLAILQCAISDNESDYRAVHAFRYAHATSPVVFGDVP